MIKYRKLKLNQQCVYIYKETDLEVIVHRADGEIVSESLLQSDDEGSLWSLFCLTNHGHVYRVGNKQARTAQREIDKNNHEIFSDLLDEEEDEFGISVHAATTPIYVLQPRDRILSLTGKALGLCVTSEILSVVIDDARDYTIYLYEISEPFNDNLSVNKQVKVLKFPKRNACLFDKETVARTVIKAAVLVDKTKDLVYSTDQVLLGEILFMELFGKDTFLLNVPVLLLCVPEGSVYYASVKSFLFLEHEWGGSETSGAELAQCAGGGSLLCETASPVVDILQASLVVNKSGENSPVKNSTIYYQDTLVLCCKSGRIIVYFTDKLDSAGAIVSELDVASPIMVAASCQNRLYHCTGEQMYETSLLAEAGGRDGKTRVSVSQTKVRKYAGVRGMLSRPKPEFIDHIDTPCMLTFATSHSEIKNIESTEFKDDIAMVTGSQIRDVLLAMDKVDAEKKKIHEVLKEQDHVLQQVNIALNLINWNSLNTPHKRDSSGQLEDHAVTPPFKCLLTSRLYSVQGKTEIHLNMEIANQIGLSLSCDWRFVMRLLPRPEMSSQKDIVSVSQTLTEEFRPRESFSMTVDVKPEWVLPGFTVSVAAMLCIKDRYDWLKQANLGSDWSESHGCLSACIYSEEVDVLYFLLSNTYESKQQCLDNGSAADIRRSILKLAETKPMWNVYRESYDKESTYNTPVCLSHRFHLLESTYEQLQNQFGKGTDCSAVTMLGQVVYLSVSTVAMETAEVGAVHVEVKVRSASSTAAAVHAAVVRNMKPLENGQCLPPVPIIELKKKLHQLQELQEEIQMLSESKGGTHEDAGKLTLLYEKLRSLQVI